MKFLLIASFPDSLIQFRGPLIDSLIASGLDVIVAAPDLDLGSPIRQKLENRGVQVHNIALNRTGTNPFADLFTLYILFQLMIKVRPDYILGYTIKPVIYGTLAARLAGVPNRFALITGLGYAFTGKPTGIRGFINSLVQSLYKFALKSACKVFFQNSDDQFLFQELGLISKKVPNTVVNGSGVDLTEFRCKPLPQGTITFLLIARLLGDKGVREFVKSAQILRSMHKDVRFILVGWIDDNPDSIRKSELDQWIEEGTVEFLGRLHDVRTAIEQCNVYVLPSYREGTPRTVLEAMAMGRPIITTDAPGCRETVVDGENGFLVPVKSVDKLVSAMLKFVSDPSLARSMGNRSRLIAESKYDVSIINKVMLREMGVSS